MGSVKKYQCEKCSKTYNHRQHLYRHKQSSIKSVIHDCIQCSKVFVRADTLKKHRKKLKRTVNRRRKFAVYAVKSLLKYGTYRDTEKHICNRKTNVSVVTATKRIQENHFVDAILKNILEWVVYSLFIKKIVF